MTRQQFENALTMAKDDSVNLFGENISMFLGYGQPEFETVVCKTSTVAALFRYSLISALEEYPNILENFFKKCEHTVFVVD